MRNELRLLICVTTLCIVSALAGAAHADKMPEGVEYFEHQMAGGTVLAVFLVDAAKFECRVDYSNPPDTVSGFAKKHDALLTVNGGYWNADYTPTDLLVAGGKVIKKPNTVNYHFGLFYAKNGKCNVRDVRRSPIGKNEKFDHAIKAGPTLIKPGGRKYLHKSTSRHARNAVGKDKKGRLFFVLNKTGRITYNELVDFLASDKIKADYAFNLDGGRSTGYTLRLDGKTIHQRKSAPVSSVIMIFEKK